MKKIASTVINKSISKDIINIIDSSKLFIVERDVDNEIITVTLDSILVNEILNQITDAVENNLKRIENKNPAVLDEYNLNESYFFVPTGIVFGSSFLNNIGPRIPINLKLVGNVTTNLVTSVEEYGINNSLIIISVEIQVEEKVILPISSDFVSITNLVPIAIKLIQGKVPVYYQKGYGSSVLFQ